MLHMEQAMTSPGLVQPRIEADLEVAEALGVVLFWCTSAGFRSAVLNRALVYQPQLLDQGLNSSNS